MKHRFIFVFFALLLAVTSILAPMPDAFKNINITGSGGQLGLDKASAANLAAVTVDSIASSHSLDYSNQRKVVYAASRFWLFYDNSTDIICRSSLDGNTWSSATVIIPSVVAVGGQVFSIWWDGTHISIAEGSSETAINYREYTPDATGTLTPSAGWQEVVTGGAGSVGYPFVCKDSSGYPVVSYSADNTTTTTPWVIKSNQTDGTWTTDNFNTQLSTTDDSWNTNILPLSDNNLIAIYARDGQTIKSKIYNGSTWATENATTSAIEVGSYFSAVVDSSNVVHMTFLKDADDDIKYTHYHSGGTAWETEETVYAGTSATMAPVLSKTLDDNLYCFWMGDPTADHIYYKAQVSGVWDTTAEDWLTEVDITANSLISCAYAQTSTNYIPVIWLVDDGANYDVRFAGLERFSGEGSGWLLSTDNIPYATRTPIPITGAGTVGANHIVGPIILYKPGENTTLDYNASHWSVNSKNYHYRFSFTIEERGGDNQTGYVCSFPLDTQSLLEEGYFAVGCDGNEVEFAISTAATTPLNYEVHTAEFGQIDTTYHLVVTLSASTTHTFYCYVDPSLTGTSTSCVALVPAPLPIGVGIAASADDSVTYGTNWYNTATGSTVAYWFFGYSPWNSAMRWRLYIPNGSTILSATVLMCSDGDYSATTMLTNLYFEQANNPSAPSSYADFVGRSLGSAVAWDSIGSWASGSYYPTPELKTILQTVVDRSGWAEGNYVQLFWKDDGGSFSAVRSARAYNHATGPSPALRVSFTYPEPLVSIPVLRPNGIDTECLSWPYDIAFTSDDGTTELPFFTDTKYVQYAKAWVKASASLSAGENTTIYCYHGLDNITVYDSESDVGMFNDAGGFGDDFTGDNVDTGLWTESSSIGYNSLTTFNGLWHFARTPGFRYHGTYDRTYLSWVDTSGYIRLTYLDHDTDEWALGPLGQKLTAQPNTISGDTHHSPVIIVPSTGTYAGYIFIICCTDGSASTNGMMVFRSAFAEDISCMYYLGRLIEGSACAYPSLLELGDGSIACLFMRDACSICRSITTDGGVTWTSTNVISDAGPWVYPGAVQYDNTTHIFWSRFAAGGGRQDVKYAKNTNNLTAGYWATCNGTDLGAEPIAVSSCEYVHDLDGLYLHDVGVDSSGNPYALSTLWTTGWTAQPYWYTFVSNAWVTSNIGEDCLALSDRADHLPMVWNTAGTLDFYDPTHIVLGVYQSDVTSVLQEWHTTDNGSSWHKEADITTGDTERPCTPMFVSNYDDETRLFYSNVLSYTDSTHWKAYLSIASYHDGNWTLGMNKYHCAILNGTSYAPGRGRIDSDVTVDTGKMFELQVLHFDTTPDSQVWFCARASTSNNDNMLRIMGDSVAREAYIEGDRDAEAASHKHQSSAIRANVFQNWQVMWLGQDNASIWIEGDKLMSGGVSTAKTADVIIPTSPTLCQSDNSYITLNEGTVDGDYTFVDYIIARDTEDMEPTWETGGNITYNPLDIAISPSTWTEFYKESTGSHTHNFRENTWYSSDNDANKDYFAITNNGGASIDILISSSDNWTGTGVVWHVSPTGDPDDHTIGIWSGLSTDSGYDRLVKPDEPANFLCTNVGTTHPTHDVTFGLLVWTCTSNGGNASMSGTITLTAVVHT